MAHIKTNSDIIMSGTTLQEFEFSHELGMEIQPWLERLRAEPTLASRLLETENANIIYMGREKNDIMGMKFVSKTDFSQMKGQNQYGKFLMGLRDTFRKELALSGSTVTPVQLDDVVVDFTLGGQRGGQESFLTGMERDGERFVHTDPLPFIKFGKFLDADDPLFERMTAAAAPWKSFVNPFGVSQSSPVKVDTAAEASLLYERGIRGELAAGETVRSLIDRGKLPQMGDDAFAYLVRGIEEQFKWIRTQIRTAEDFSDRQVVSQELLVPDASMGRSIYHPIYAPSPAHILAYYMKNPLLLDDTSSECITARALELKSHEEVSGIAPLVGAKRAVIVVDGSDTIGGRVPNTRGVKKRDARTKKEFYEFQLKSNEEVLADYSAFSQRLDEVLSRIPEDMEILLVVDGDRRRGMNDMVRRYVEEHKGGIYQYDYVQGNLRREESDRNRSVSSHFTMVAMPHFDWVQPVLAGGVSSVEIPLEDSDETLSFRSSQLTADGYILFSDLTDNRSAQFLHRGAIAVAAGLPTVHVMNLQSQAQQAEALSVGVGDSRLTFMGGVDFGESLFSKESRTQWNVNPASAFFRPEGESSLLFERQDGAVYVGGVPFSTIAGAYTAMLAREALSADATALRTLSEGEESREQMILAVSSLGFGKKISPAVQEKCLRNAVRQMATVSSSLRRELLGSGEEEIVISSDTATAAGKNTVLSGLNGKDSLFNWLTVDASGKGQNALGVALMAERTSIRTNLDIIRKRAQEEARKIAEEQSRALRRSKNRHAVGQKMQAGFPEEIEDLADAVWFGGTARPLGLVDDERESFVYWDNEKGADPLVRELAGRESFVMGDETIPNGYIFIGATNALVASGRLSVKNFPNGRDLTGVTRVDPKTGEKFVCAFSVPVKRDLDFNEPNNPDGLPSSFFNDADSELVRAAFIETFAQARSAAMDRGLALCTERYCNSNLSVFSPTLGLTFEEETFVPKIEITTVRNEKTGKKEQRPVRKWERAQSAHQSKRLSAIVDRSLAMLENSKELPLNFFCLPRTDYQEEMVDGVVRTVSDEVFLADLEFAVRSADALAVRRGVPLRFALHENGRIDLGPGLTEHQRGIAEQFIDSYIGVRKDVSLEKEMDISRISDLELYKIRKERDLEKEVFPFFTKPNSLMSVFGKYDFSNMLNGNADVLHRMNFIDGEGDVFQIYEPRISSRCTTEEINDTLAYERNTERRFLVRSSNPDKIPAFIAQVEDIINRVQEVGIEYRLVSPGEFGQNEQRTMEGYFELLPSNSLGDEDVEEKFVVRTRDNDNPANIHSTLDFSDKKDAYAGHVTAKDSFKGYVEYRPVINGVPNTEWTVITDKETWKEVVMSANMREYRSDLCRIASKATIEDFLRSDFVSRLGLSFVRSSVLDKIQSQSVTPDSKIVSGKYIPVSKKAAKTKAAQEEPAVEEKPRKSLKMNVNKFIK